MNAPAIQPERTTPLRATTAERLAGGAVATIAVSVLGIAAWLTPSDQGHGTHLQMGLPACTWTVWFDKPCPTCGMTTAFATAGEGRWLDAFNTQPAGMVFSVMTAAAFWLGAHTLLTGSRIGGLVASALRPKTVTLLIAGFLAAWGYKLLTW
ncbi:MAG: DUF2752 domain-containing protein [Phycisphaerales bacterium]